MAAAATIGDEEPASAAYVDVDLVKDIAVLIASTELPTALEPNPELPPVLYAAAL